MSDPQLAQAQEEKTTDVAVTQSDPPAGDSILACRDLSRWYGDVIAVNDVTLDVGRGVTGLLGPNGAGKSTLIRMAMGLARPSAGSIEILGENPWNNPGLLRRIGYVPEGDAPWRDLTGQRATTLAARLSGLSGNAAEQAARDALDVVGLKAAADKRVDAYSRGMRQRLKFAIAILNDPELLILDEPLLGTDPLTRRDLIKTISDFARDGKSILVSTHVLPDVEVMTRRILLLNHGRVMAHGEVSAIRDLLDRYPRTVRIVTSSPRELGAALWGLDAILSLEAEAGAVVVRTTRPQQFFEDLQALLLARPELPFTSLTSLDDNVEAVFRYLVR